MVSLHNPTNKGEAKNIINESHIVTLFIHGLGDRILKYIFQDYLGLSTKQIKKIKKMSDDSSYISVCKGARGAPRCILSEKMAYVNLYNNDSDSD